jgi:hypothetical protein
MCGVRRCVNVIWSVRNAYLLLNSLIAWIKGEEAPPPGVKAMGDGTITGECARLHVLFLCGCLNCWGLTNELQRRRQRRRFSVYLAA